MRLKAAFVVVAMAALGAAESSAAIYELGSSAPTAPPLEMSPDQARLGLAQALGVSRFYKLGAQGTADKRIEVLEQLAHMENRIGAVAGGEGRFLLSLAGVGAEDADGTSECAPMSWIVWF